MNRRRWEFMDRLKTNCQPEDDSRAAYTEEISTFILESFVGEVDTQVEEAVTATASIITDMWKNDTNFVTPSDVGYAAEDAEFGVSGMVIPQLKSEIRSWLPHAGLEEVDPSYCDRDEFKRWDEIWVAPIFPKLDEIVEALDDPLAISLSTLRDVLVQPFDEPNPNDNPDESREVTHEDVDAFQGYVRKQLEEDWVNIPVDIADEEVWINPNRVDEILRAEGTKLSADSVTQRIVSTLLETPEVKEEAIAEFEIGELGELMDVLKEVYGWNRLVTTENVFWYGSIEPFEKAYSESAEEAQNIYYNQKEASLEKLHRAKIFFEHNEEVLLEKESTTPRDIRGVARKLKHRLAARKDSQKLDSSIPKDELSSSFEYESKPNYFVAKEFEEMLEEMKEDREDDEDEDKGLSGYRF